MKKVCIVVLAALWLLACTKAPAEKAEGTANPEKTASVTNPSETTAVADGSSPVQDGKTVEKPEAGEQPSAVAQAAEPSPEELGQQLIDKAIEAHGGLENLKKLGAYQTTSKGTYMGGAYKMKTLWLAPSYMMMDVNNGEWMSGYLGDDCWSSSRRIVVDCPAMEKDNMDENLMVTHMSHLYPLKEEGTRIVKLDDVTLEGKACPTVEVQMKEAPIPLRLSFDPESMQILRMSWTATMMGKPTLTTADVKENRNIEGVVIPAKLVTTLGEEPFMDEELTAVTFGELEASAFNRPAQIELGQPELSDWPETAVAAVSATGPYDKLGMTIQMLYMNLGARGMIPMGPPMMLYVKGPEQTANPEEYITEVMVPLAQATDEQLTEEGQLKIRRLPAMTVVHLVEKGPYATVSRSYGLLANWASSHGWQIAGPAGMITHSNPMNTKEEELISELFFEVKKVQAEGSEADVVETAKDQDVKEPAPEN